MAPANPFDWTFLELCGALNDITFHVLRAIGDLPHNVWNILVISLGLRDWALAPGTFTLHLGIADWLFIQNRSVMVPLIGASLILMFSMINVLMFIWVERKLLARFMDRRGPMVAGPFGLLQNVWDGMKLLTKENARPARTARNRIRPVNDRYSLFRHARSQLKRRDTRGSRDSA